MWLSLISALMVAHLGQAREDKQTVNHLQLDCFLVSAAHVNMPHAQIRQRALVQYTMPFTSVKLASMAQAFNSTEA